MKEIFRNIVVASVVSVGGITTFCPEENIYDASKIISVDSVEGAYNFVNQRETVEDLSLSGFILSGNAAVWWAAKRFSDSTEKNSIEEKLLWSFPSMFSAGSALSLGLVWT